jgi:hypothetical protein
LAPASCNVDMKQRSVVATSKGSAHAAVTIDGSKPLAVTRGCVLHAGLAVGVGLVCGCVGGWVGGCGCGCGFAGSGTYPSRCTTRSLLVSAPSRCARTPPCCSLCCWPRPSLPLDAPIVGCGSVWAWEMQVVTDTYGEEAVGFGISISKPSSVTALAYDSSSCRVFRAFNGKMYTNGSKEGVVARAHPGDVIKMTLDMDEGTLAFAINGAVQPLMWTGIVGTACT